MSSILVGFGMKDDETLQLTFNGDGDAKGCLVSMHTGRVFMCSFHPPILNVLYYKVNGTLVGV